MKVPFWLPILWLSIFLAAWPVMEQAWADRHPVPQQDLTASVTLYQNKQYPEAIAAAQRYLERQPDSERAFVNIGMSYASMSKWGDAIPATQHALVIKPDFQLAWNDLRWMFASRLAAHPTPEAYEDQAVLLYRAGDFRGCVDRARLALKLFPQYTKVFNLLSVCFLNLGMFDDAIGNAQEALRLEPAFQSARQNLNLALEKKAKTPASLDTVASYLNASLANYRSGHMQECIDTAREALKLQPNLAVAYNNIAACSNDLGRPDDAIAAAQEALRLQPDMQIARNNLAFAVALKARQGAARK